MVNLAMDGVSEHINPAEVRAFLSELPGVVAMHDVHIWGMSTTDAALTAHLLRPEPDADNDRFLAEAAKELHDRFRIEHVTLQVEKGNGTVCLVGRRSFDSQGRP